MPEKPLNPMTQAFVREGRMVAFPLCYPGASAPLPPDESRITALASGSAGRIVYGGTSGRVCHFFVALLHDSTGAVLTLGSFPGPGECTAVCIGEKHQAFLCINTSVEGRILLGNSQVSYNNYIQEWGHIPLTPLRDIRTPVAGEPIRHALAAPDCRSLVGVTPGALFRFDFADETVQMLRPLKTVGKLVMSPGGLIYGLDTDQRVWSYCPADGSFNECVARLPAGDWYRQPALSYHPVMGCLFLADNNGQLVTLTPDGTCRSLPYSPLSPVYTMAATHDGRIFGMAGEGLANLWVYEPRSNAVADLGAVISLFERRRYGYVFADAVTGRDGEIIFAENDDLGHLWFYYPRILPVS